MSKYGLGVVACCIFTIVVTPCVDAMILQADNRAPILPQMVPIRVYAEPSAGFAMSTREVTWKQYLQSVDQAHCPMPQTSYGKDRDALSAADPQIRDNYPVTGVSAVHVRCYITWLNRAAKAAYRLPSLNEWQVAAGKAQPRLWSSWERAKAATLVRSDPRSSVRNAMVEIVASGPPTSDGLFDLEGNAGEMLSDTHQLSGQELRECGQVGLASKDVPLLTGQGGYLIEDGRELPADFRSVGHSVCGIAMTGVGFRLATSLTHPPIRSKPH
jgi:formylglycine-generating enzyme required for sulfatase activity